MDLFFPSYIIFKECIFLLHSCYLNTPRKEWKTFKYQRRTNDWSMIPFPPTWNVTHFIVHVGGHVDDDRVYTFARTKESFTFYQSSEPFLPNRIIRTSAFERFAFTNFLSSSATASISFFSNGLHLEGSYVDITSKTIYRVTFVTVA